MPDKATTVSRTLTSREHAEGVTVYIKALRSDGRTVRHHIFIHNDLREQVAEILTRSQP